MKATETNLSDLLSGKKQYLMPLYQRAYSWTPKQFEQLWNDLVELAEAFVPGLQSSHFLGSMVLAPAPSLVPAGVAEWLVVDGQQRLTTLTILLAAIRDHASLEDPEAVQRIDEQYLVNKWAGSESRYKINPTQLDRVGYRAIIDRLHGADRGEGVAAAYRYFRSQLERFDDPDDAHDVRRLEEAIVNSLSIVVISAQHGDNVHRIFESLNNTGVRLTQADLLRNYFFMRMPTRGESAYAAYWLPMQETLTADQLEQVVWLDLILRGNETVRRDEIYRAQQGRLEDLTNEEHLELELVGLHRRAQLFRTILDPTLEPDAAVRAGLVRLAEWGAQTTYPPVLKLLELRADERASSEQVSRCLHLLESYLVRRMVVGRATNNLNRILNSLPGDLTGDEPVEAQLHASLSLARKYWPTDTELLAAVTSGPFYWRGRANQRSFVLRRLEESYRSKEPVDFTSLTIEHVMPQTPSEEWWDQLMEEVADGEDIRSVHSQVVHTLGNLTLTGYNSTLSNKPFAVKRVELAQSGIRMNQEIAAHEMWTTAAIRARGEQLADRCIEIWDGPTAGVEESNDSATLVNLRVLLAAIPPGTWTTYGDVATVVGSAAMAIGTLLSLYEAPNPWRVLNSQGKIASGFRWTDDTNTADPVELLRADGVKISADGIAHPSQRLSLADLADLLGVQVDEPAEFVENEERRSRFEAELAGAQPTDVVAATLDVLQFWRGLGGRVVYGSGQETSAIFKAVPYGHNGFKVWCGAIYPSGSVQIWFQHLKSKEPFTDPLVREELRQRLTVAAAIDIPPSKLGLRPSFALAALADPEAAAALRSGLAFVDEAMKADTRGPSAVDDAESGS